MNEEHSQKSWCESVAALGVDVLIDRGLIKEEDCELAIELLAQEILVRLCLDDYPPRSGNP